VAFIVKDPGRNESKNELSIADTNGVAGIVSTLIPSDKVEMRREYIDDLALAFVAPLSAHYDNVFHVSLFPKVLSARTAVSKKLSQP